MKLSPRQKQAALLLKREGGGICWWRVGEGKTRIALTYFAMIAKRDGFTRFLVVCREEAFSSWEHEVRKCGLKWHVSNFHPSLPFSYLPGPTIYLLSHGMIARHVASIMNLGFDAICLDELYLYKNPSTQKCKEAHALCTHIGEAIGLSGSIMTAQNLEDVWGQLYAIGKSDVLAPTLTQFRDEHTRKLELGGAARTFWKTIPRSGSLAIVAKRVRSVASVYFPKSQRKARHIKEYVSPTKDQTYLMGILRDEYIQMAGRDGEEKELKNAMSVMLAGQQIANGWAKSSTGDIVRFHSNKTEWVKHKVDEILEQGDRVIIWCAFRRDVAELDRIITHPTCTMVSGKKFDEKRWKKTARVAVATEASGSSVNYFGQCAYAIYFSMDAHWLHLQQSRGRTDRKNSAHSMATYYYVFVEDSFDSTMFRLATASGAKEQELLVKAQMKNWIQK